MTLTYKRFIKIYLLLLFITLFSIFIYIFVLPAPVYISKDDLAQAKRMVKAQANLTTAQIYKPLTPVELKAYNTVAVPIRTEDDITVFYIKKDKNTGKLSIEQQEILKR